MLVCDICRTEQDIVPGAFQVDDKPGNLEDTEWTLVLKMDVCPKCREHLANKQWYVLAQRAKQVVIRPYLTGEVARAGQLRPDEAATGELR